YRCDRYTPAASPAIAPTASRSRPLGVPSSSSLTRIRYRDIRTPVARRRCQRLISKSVAGKNKATFPLYFSAYATLAIPHLGRRRDRDGRGRAVLFQVSNFSVANARRR